MSSILLRKTIEEKIFENFLEYQDLFVETQSHFLTRIYKRYQSLESGNLFLYFARQAHQDILRQKDYDLNFNLSLDKFWENLNLANPKNSSIIKIAKETCLPKETARRKILELVKQKVLSKKNKNIRWLPNDFYKKKYDLFIYDEIKNYSKLLIFVCKKINISISREEVIVELKKKFNFYWFHYLGAQLEYLKLWSVQLKDLELVLISLQILRLLSTKAKEKKLSIEDTLNDPSVIKDFNSASISATSISEVTGIPRATCIRKLEKLVKLKMIKQDHTSKRYYLIPTSVSKNIISEEVTRKVTKVFCEFYFICLRAISIKPSS